MNNRLGGPARTVTRRDFCRTIAAGVFVFASGVRLAAAQDRKRPNILLITTDQQRIDAMSALGNKWVRTPHMDSIAANGVYFRKSYCIYPLCSPSRASLHTGRPPHEIGVDHNSQPIDRRITVSGEVFKAAGYDTAYSGKWHLPASYPEGGIPGFEVLNRMKRTGAMARDLDATALNQAVDFLKRKRNRPFYLVVSFLNPHDICLLANKGKNAVPVKKQIEARYMPSANAELPPLPDNFNLPAGATEALAKRAESHAGWDENQWRRYRYAYYRMMEDVDKQVGELLAALRATGQEENTLIVFTSDHGEGLGCHRMTAKTMYFDDEAAVPLILSWKGVIPTGRMDREHLVSTMDVLPTICDYAGIQAPEKMRGRSLRAVIEQPGEQGHEFVVSEMAFVKEGRSFMVRTKRYKYMFFSGSKTSEMFFDMDADPGEMNNLAGKETVADEIGRHRKLLEQWPEATEEARHPITSDEATGEKKARKKAEGKKGKAK